VEQREKALFDLFWNGIKIEHCGADETSSQESITRDWLLW
jgi:hypothetical protein